MVAGGPSRGISGNGLRTGIHMMRAVSSQPTWSTKWMLSDRSVAFITVVQWVNTMNALKVTSAKNGRHTWRAVVKSQRGDSTQRASHAGVPRSSSGGATSEINV